MKEKTNKIKRSKSRIVFQIINYSVLIIYALLCLLPLINLGAISLSSPELADGGLVGLIPKKATLSAYSYIFKDTDFLKALWNSVKLIVIGIPVTMLLTFLCAYPLSRPNTKFVGRTVYIVILWVCILFSGGLVPEYMLKCALNLKNTIWALILPGVPVFNVILLMNFFRGVSEEMHEAAEIDGASEMRILFTVYIPIALPAVITTMLFAIVELYNQWLPGIMYFSTIDKMPLQSFLQSVTIDFMDSKLEGVNISQTTIDSAMAFLSIIPMLILYLPLQRFFVKGISLGGVKG